MKSDYGLVEILILTTTATKGILYHSASTTIFLSSRELCLILPKINTTVVQLCGCIQRNKFGTLEQACLLLQGVAGYAVKMSNTRNLKVTSTSTRQR